MYFEDLKDGFTSQEILCSSSHRIMNDKQIIFKDQNLFPDCDEWPTKTDVHCWYCSHQFDGVPVSIPVDFKDDWWSVRGVFCSFSCAKSFIVRNCQGDYRQLMLLNSFASICFNRKKEITMSPPFHVLKKFGGCMEIEEFRGRASKGEEVICLENKFRPCSATVQIHTNNPSASGFRVGQVMGIRRNTVTANQSSPKKKMSKFDEFVKKKQAK